MYHFYPILLIKSSSSYAFLILKLILILCCCCCFTRKGHLQKFIFMPYGENLNLLIIMIKCSNIASIKQLFVAIRKFFWCLCKDTKNLKCNQDINVVIYFYVFNKGVKLGVGDDLLSNRLVPDSKNPLKFTFTMSKKEVFSKNNLNILAKKHLEVFKNRIYHKNINFKIYSDTILEIVGYEFF